MEIIIGLLIVSVAGLGTGAGGWPMKVIKEIHFEQYLFFKIVFGVVLFPWFIFLISISDPILVIKTVGYKTILITNFFTLSWGVATILYIVCVIRIGAALTGAILSALGMSVGVILPMVLKGSGLFNNAPNLFSKPGIVILIGLFVMIIGVILVSIAGFGRERVLKKESIQIQKERASGNFRQGLLLVILAGICSSGPGLAFVYGQGPIIEAAKQQGAGVIAANMTVWALVFVGGALLCILYAAFWMTKKKTWNLLFSRKDEIICGALLGLQLIVSFTLMGRGMVLLGILGASIGYGIQQSMQIVGNQIVGFVGGEWKGVKGMPRQTLYLALIVIFIAVIIFAYTRTLV